MKVSVAMITYNHEKFIAQAIEGVLMQESDFDYELIIGEDCSTDGTAAIVANYQQRHPDKIRAIIRDKNIGAMPNFIDVLARCNGEYVAFCEGDDYWTDPRKLQKQVDLMDSDPGCVLCCHRVEHVYDEGCQLESPLEHCFEKDFASVEDILVHGNLVPTLSAVFRNHLVGNLPAWYVDLPFGDWPLWILLAQYGHIRFISETMAAYRIHCGGMRYRRDLDEWWKAELKMYGYLNELWQGKYRQAIRFAESRVCLMLALACEKRGEVREARAYAWRAFRVCPPISECGSPIRHLLRLYLPGFYKAMRSMHRRCGMNTQDGLGQNSIGVANGQGPGGRR